MRLCTRATLIALFILCASQNIFAQFRPGMIVRECTDPATGRTVLNPNYASVSSLISGTTYHFASSTNSGWTLGGDDTTSAANGVPFKPLKPYGGEPCCDLRRGADHRFSDFVPDNNNNGVYFYYNATQSAYVFRMRMGTMSPGSKGFSLLVDTDLKYGNTGSYADPNYVAKTTGINGNPGFELEIVLETGFRLAIYNIDGKGEPSVLGAVSPSVSHTNWQAYSQIVMAATSESGDPDFFIDFYVPLSDLTGINITDALTGSVGTPFISAATQKIRIIPTTVMAPKPSTAGPISDIYGSDMDKITWYPPVCSTCNVNAICTTAPVITSVNGPTGSIQGTWTRETTGYTGSTQAVITLYKNGDTTTQLTTNPATITCTSGGSWSATASGLVSTDVITAKAQGTGNYESRYCFTSNAKRVTSCSSQPGQLAITTASGTGFNGTGYLDNVNGNGSGASSAGADYITLWKVSSSGFTRMGLTELPASSANAKTGAQAKDHYYLTGTSGGWSFNGGTGGNSNAAITAGEYVIYDSTALGCLSKANFYCLASTSSPNASTASNTNAPTLTSPTTITTSTRTISGSWDAGSVTPTVIRVYLQGNYLGNATIAGSTWTYNFQVSLSENDEVRIKSQGNESGSTYYCAGQLVATVAAASCSNPTPFIDVDSTTSMIIPGFKLSGLGTAGGTLKIYNSTNVMKDSLTVGSDGTWTSSYVASTGDVAYYATLKTAGCSNIATSATKTVSVTNTPATFCDGYIVGSTYGQITGPSGTNNILYSDETSISGTLSSSGGLATSGTFIKIYLDSTVVGYSSVNTGNNTWGPVDVSGMLFNGAILTIGVVKSGTMGEYVCSSVRVVCSCALSHMPAKPAVDASSITTVASGGNPVIKIRNPVAGNYYGVKDSTTGASLSKGLTYTGGDQSVSGRILADSFITITTTPITSNKTAQVVATLVGGTETCNDTTYQSLRITQVLPIELVNFQGLRKGEINKLTWKTAEEINFNGFELERSADGNHYDAIAAISPHGSNSIYEFSDKIHGSFYYRLKMKDNDGRYKYSAIVVLKEDGPALVMNVVKPNPFRNRIALSLYLEKAENIEVMLVDAAGRIVSCRKEKGVQGSNEFYINNLDNLVAGMYTLRIQANGRVFQEKMVKIDY
jgi:hypothetical protein